MSSHEFLTSSDDVVFQPLPIDEAEVELSIKTDPRANWLKDRILAYIGTDDEDLFYDMFEDPATKQCLARFIAAPLKANELSLEKRTFYINKIIVDKLIHEDKEYTEWRKSLIFLFLVSILFLHFVCLVGLVVSMFDCKSRGPGFDSRVGSIINIVLGFSIRKLLVLARSLEIGCVSPSCLRKHVKPSVLHLNSLWSYRNFRPIGLFDRGDRECTFVCKHTCVARLHAVAGSIWRTLT